MAKWKSKLKKNSKYDKNSKRYQRNENIRDSDRVMCKKKTAYSGKGADKAILTLRTTSNIHCRKYRCPVCNGYHIAKEKR